MPRAFSLLLMLLAGYLPLKSEEGPLERFLDPASGHYGYKNSNGEIVFQPQFLLTGSACLQHVAAVIGANGKSYYISRDGKTFGVDSLYYFDNAPDAEREGFIRFRDPKTGLAGMFDRNGKVVVPADYNDLGGAHNGMIHAIKGATKTYWGEPMNSEGHYTWTGGMEVLIDTMNRLLIENFHPTDEQDYYSVIISNKPSTDSIRDNFRGVNGNYYSFINYQREFRQWLSTALPDKFTQTQLLAASHHSIKTWKPKAGWQMQSSISFIPENFFVLRNAFCAMYVPGADVFISTEMQSFLSAQPEPCTMEEPAPIMQIIISQKINGKLQQDCFYFTRASGKYELICVTLQTATLK